MSEKQPSVSVNPTNHSRNSFEEPDGNLFFKEEFKLFSLDFESKLFKYFSIKFIFQFF